MTNRGLCPKCGKRERVRKDQLRFYGECEPCGSTRLVHVNASLIDMKDANVN